MNVYIRGIGTYLPEKIVSNHDLAKQIDTSDEWIWSRTGIRERRIAAEGEHASTMGKRAAEEAIRNAGLSPDDIDLLVVATMTPDFLFPSTAAVLQAQLGLRNVPAFDISAACSGFLYGLEVTRHLLQSGTYRNALLVGTEKLSSVLDWQDRSTCVLFGDGAGAVVLSQGATGIIDVLLAADGSNPDILYMPGGGSRMPATEASVAHRDHFLKMNGREVFKVAVRAMEQSIRDILDRNSININDIRYFIAHQANYRILDALAQRLSVPMEKFPVNVDRVGNTSAASIPLIMKEMVDDGRLKSGDNVVLVAFGAGLTWGTSLLKWKDSREMP
ncbi:MAG: 3-oxoacyl-ACP synthase [Verrucomicrobia bacterium GWF2_51_19]|nr:MAG: 3-oxoacyl-ACP synthase [Verrucomicrobia bacterium GWF2_51_19]HCJ12326.1 3-oxoacyl-ACP synthase [Opitutae bacterium]